MDSAVICAKFQNKCTIESNVMDEQYFARFGFKMRFGCIYYIAQGPTMQNTYERGVW